MLALARSRFRPTLAAAIAALGTVTACGTAAGPEPAAGAESAGAHHATPEGIAKEYATMAEEIESEGGETTQGRWRIGYVVEPAEPWFETSGGRQVKREPAPGETHHIEILPFEASTGRLVPNTPVRLEVLDTAGAVVDAQDLQFLYGEFFHYADNFSVPEAGDYTLRATIGAPTFLRHGEDPAELTLTEGATVEFPGVRLES